MYMVHRIMYLLQLMHVCTRKGSAEYSVAVPLCTSICSLLYAFYATCYVDHHHCIVRYIVHTQLQQIHAACIVVHSTTSRSNIRIDRQIAIYRCTNIMLYRTCIYYVRVYYAVLSMYTSVRMCIIVAACGVMHRDRRVVHTTSHCSNARSYIY